MFFLSKKQILISIGALALFLLIAISIFFALEYNGANGSRDEVIVSIPEGSGAGQIAEILADKGIIKNEVFFKWAAKISNKSNGFKQGAYKISGNMGYTKIIGILTGEIKSEAIKKITIPEGFELRMIAERLTKEGLVSSDFINIANESEFNYNFIKDLPKRENMLEGYLFPETYFINEGLSSKEIIEVMLKQFDKEFTDEYRQRAKELNMTIDQIVTLASIIQREAKNVEEMPIVSAVFHNRLKNKQYPYLESCATVQYILKDRKPVLSVKDTKINSPYNTYINKGLPIGPIASPGREAIKAALYPADVEYMFFALNKDGNHVFSETYAEHLKIVNGGK